MKRTITIITAIIGLIVSGLAVSIAISKNHQEAEPITLPPDDGILSSNDLIFPDNNEVSSIEMMKGDGKSGESYICTDEYIIADLLCLIATATPTGKHYANDTPADDYYYSIKIRCDDDNTVSLFGYVVLVDEHKCWFEVPDKGIYSADSELYYIVGDLVAED